MLRRLLIGLLINAAAFWVAIEVLPNIDFDGRIVELVLIALAFGLVNTFIRPIVKLFTLPVTLVTLGLFSFAVNGLMLLPDAATKS